MSLCLTMIVKNEASVIQRCLRSVKPFIDSYSISDTGSTDNTMELIREELAGIPGVLMSDPWEDFSTNRNLALSRCTGDHILTIDADEVLKQIDGPLTIDPEFDGFRFHIVYADTTFWRLGIIRNDPRWKYRNKVHEALIFEGEPRIASIENFTILTYYDGHRNQLGDKLERDLKVLESEPVTPRNAFYQAVALTGLKRYDEAIKKYYERVQLGGRDEDVYYSLFKAGETMQLAGRPLDEIAGALFRAYSYRPTRFEALVALCMLLRENKQWQLIYDLTRIDPKPSDDVNLVNRHAHWLVIEEHAVAAYWLGKYDEARECFLRVQQYDIPPDARERTAKNIGYCDAPHFSSDKFKQNIENWTKELLPYRGKPNLRFLEIGCSEGRATRWLLDNILTHPTSAIEVIDSFENTNVIQSALENNALTNSGSTINISATRKTFEHNIRPFARQVFIHHGRSRDVLPELAPKKQAYYDFIYIDGSHHKDDVYKDSMLTWPLLKDGGILAFDDYEHSGIDPETGEKWKTKTLIDRFLAEHEGEYYTLLKGWQLHIRKAN